MKRVIHKRPETDTVDISGVDSSYIYVMYDPHGEVFKLTKYDTGLYIWASLCSENRETNTDTRRRDMTQTMELGLIKKRVVLEFMTLYELARFLVGHPDYYSLPDDLKTAL